MLFPRQLVMPIPVTTTRGISALRTVDAVFFEGVIGEKAKVVEDKRGSRRVRRRFMVKLEGQNNEVARFPAVKTGGLMYLHYVFAGYVNC